MVPRAQDKTPGPTVKRGRLPPHCLPPPSCPGASLWATLEWGPWPRAKAPAPEGPSVGKWGLSFLPPALCPRAPLSPAEPLCSPAAHVSWPSSLSGRPGCVPSDCLCGFRRGREPDAATFTWRCPRPRSSHWHWTSPPCAGRSVSTVLPRTGDGLASPRAPHQSGRWASTVKGTCGEAEGAELRGPRASVAEAEGAGRGAHRPEVHQGDERAGDGVRPAREAEGPRGRQRLAGGSPTAGGRGRRGARGRPGPTVRLRPSPPVPGRAAGGGRQRSPLGSEWPPPSVALAWPSLCGTSREAWRAEGKRVTAVGVGVQPAWKVGTESSCHATDRAEVVRTEASGRRGVTAGKAGSAGLGTAGAAAHKGMGRAAGATAAVWAKAQALILGPRDRRLGQADSPASPGVERDPVTRALSSGPRRPVFGLPN